MSTDRLANFEQALVSSLDLTGFTVTATLLGGPEVTAPYVGLPPDVGSVAWFYEISEGAYMCVGSPAAVETQSYAPTWGGLTVGNGTVSGDYYRVGKLWLVRASIVWGTTTAFSAGSVTATIPTTLGQLAPFGTSRCVLSQSVLRDDSAGAVYVTPCRASSATALNPRPDNTSTGTLTATTPFTWANLDEMDVTALMVATVANTP